VLAGGVESMSRAPFVLHKADIPFSRHADMQDTTIGWRFINPRLRERYGVDSMPETGENVAAECHISRADQERFAVRTPQRPAAAYGRGFGAELVAVGVPRKGKTLSVTRDEHPRRRPPSSSWRRFPPRFAPAARSPPATPPASTTGRRRCSSPPNRRRGAST
jgi:acetyl-CoA acyltransferase